MRRSRKPFRAISVRRGFESLPLRYQAEFGLIKGEIDAPDRLGRRSCGSAGISGSVVVRERTIAQTIARIQGVEPNFSPCLLRLSRAEPRIRPPMRAPAARERH